MVMEPVNEISNDSAVLTKYEKSILKGGIAIVVVIYVAAIIAEFFGVIETANLHSVGNVDGLRVSIWIYVCVILVCFGRERASYLQRLKRMKGLR